MKDTFLIILKGELRYHLREPLTILLLLVLPVVLYPGLIWAYGKAMSVTSAQQAAQVLTVSGPPSLQAFLEPEDNLRLSTGSVDPEAIKAAGKGAGASEDVVVAQVSELEAGEVTLTFVGNAARSREARARLMEVLSRWQADAQGKRFEALGMPLEPGALLRVEEEDVAPEASRAGDLLGRIIPILLVFLLSSAGLHTALDVFTGERDRGTLETLLTTRADRRAILLGKFSVVLLFTLVSGILSLLSLYATLAFGLIDLPMPAGAQAGDASALALQVGPFTLAILCLMAVPLAIQLAAMLTAIAAYAPDFRAGQALATPVVTVPALLAGVAAIPEIELSPATALLPITNISLAAREALSGSLTTGMFALVLAMTTLHAGAALYGAGRLIGRESVVLGGGGGARRLAKGDYSGVALFLFGLVMLLFWFLGQMAQAQDLVWGLILSQFGLIALPAILIMVYLGLPVMKTLGIRAPHPMHLPLVLVAGLAAPGLSFLVAELQGGLFPISSSYMEQMAEAFDVDLPFWQVLLLFAVLPGVCEELLFRGALLNLFKKALRPGPRVILVGVLFGLLHLALPRLLPTTSVGILLGAAALTSGTLVVPMILHALHNGLIFTAGEVDIPLGEDTSLLVLGAMTLVSMGAVWAMSRFRVGPAEAPPDT